MSAQAIHHMHAAIAALQGGGKKKQKKSGKTLNVWQQYVSDHYESVKHLPNKERYAALSKRFKAKKATPHNKKRRAKPQRTQGYVMADGTRVTLADGDYTITKPGS